MVVAEAAEDGMVVRHNAANTKPVGFNSLYVRILLTTPLTALRIVMFILRLWLYNSTFITKCECTILAHRYAVSAKD